MPEKEHGGQAVSAAEGGKSALCRRFEEMTDATARLIEGAINAADPEDPKVLKAITGALKDLRELMDSPPGAAGGDIVIRVEGGAPRPPDAAPDAPEIKPGERAE